MRLVVRRKRRGGQGGKDNLTDQSLPESSGSSSEPLPPVLKHTQTCHVYQNKGTLLSIQCHRPTPGRLSPCCRPGSREILPHSLATLPHSLSLLQSPLSGFNLPHVTGLSLAKVTSDCLVPKSVDDRLPSTSLPQCLCRCGGPADLAC